MTSDLDILRAAHLMLHEYGSNAELKAASYAALLLGCGDRDGVLTWSRIRCSIATMDRAASVGTRH